MRLSCARKKKESALSFCEICILVRKTNYINSRTVSDGSRALISDIFLNLRLMSNVERYLFKKETKASQLNSPFVNSYNKIRKLQDRNCNSVTAHALGETPGTGYRSVLAELFCKIKSFFKMHSCQKW